MYIYGLLVVYNEQPVIFSVNTKDGLLAMGGQWIRRSDLRFLQ
jgi:hypothetical protein